MNTPITRALALCSVLNVEMDEAALLIRYPHIVAEHDKDGFILIDNEWCDDEHGIGGTWDFAQDFIIDANWDGAYDRYMAPGGNGYSDLDWFNVMAVYNYVKYEDRSVWALVALTAPHLHRRVDWPKDKEEFFNVQ